MLHNIVPTTRPESDGAVCGEKSLVFGRERPSIATVAKNRSDYEDGPPRRKTRGRSGSTLHNKKDHPRVDIVYRRLGFNAVNQTKRTVLEKPPPSPYMGRAIPYLQVGSSGGKVLHKNRWALRTRPSQPQLFRGRVTREKTQDKFLRLATFFVSIF